MDTILKHYRYECNNRRVPKAIATALLSSNEWISDVADHSVTATMRPNCHVAGCVSRNGRRCRRCNLTAVHKQCLGAIFPNCRDIMPLSIVQCRRAGDSTPCAIVTRVRLTGRHIEGSYCSVHYRLRDNIVDICTCRCRKPHPRAFCIKCRPERGSRFDMCRSVEMKSTRGAGGRSAGNPRNGTGNRIRTIVGCIFRDTTAALVKAPSACRVCQIFIPDLIFKIECRRQTRSLLHASIGYGNNRR